MTAMTKPEIDQILDRVRTWHVSRREDAARILLAIETQDLSRHRLSDQEHADIDAALEEITRGELCSDEEVKSVFDRHRA